MSNLKLRFPLAHPSTANGALVPACCAAALVGMAVLQLVLTRDVALPAAAWSGGGVQLTMPQFGAIAIPGQLRENPVFSPDRTDSGRDAAVADGPLGATSLAGAMTIGRRGFAVLVRPDGAIVRLPVGGTIDGMQLLTLSAQGAVFRKDGQRVQVAFGPARTPPEGQPAGTEEEQE
jgi:hypothetical protein